MPHLRPENLKNYALFRGNTYIALYIGVPPPSRGNDSPLHPLHNSMHRL